jgi:hypothetical protein
MHGTIEKNLSFKPLLILVSFLLLIQSVSIEMGRADVGVFSEKSAQETGPDVSAFSFFSDRRGNTYRITWRDVYKLEVAGWVKISEIPSLVKNQFYGAYGDGKFVVNNFNEIYTSVDAITWTRGPSSSSSAETNPWIGESIRYTPAGFLVIGSNTPVAISGTEWGGYQQQIYKSVNGINWVSTTIVTPRREEFSQAIRFLDFASGRYVLVSQDFYGYSTDFASWNFGNFDSRLDKTSLTFGNGIWLVTSSSSNVLFRSTDGVSWTQYSSPNSRYFVNSIHTGDFFFAFMDQTFPDILNKMYYSITALPGEWIEIESPAESEMFSYATFDSSNHYLYIRSQSGHLFGSEVRAFTGLSANISDVSSIEGGCSLKITNYDPNFYYYFKRADSNVVISESGHVRLTGQAPGETIEEYPSTRRLGYSIVNNVASSFICRALSTEEIKEIARLASAQAEAEAAVIARALYEEAMRLRLIQLEKDKNIVRDIFKASGSVTLEQLEKAGYLEASSKILERFNKEVLKLSLEDRLNENAINNLIKDLVFDQAFFDDSDRPTIDVFLKYGISGVSERTIREINREILEIQIDQRSDLTKIKAIALKLITIDRLVNPITSSNVTAYDLAKIGLISESNKNKTSILSAIKKLPKSRVDSYQKLEKEIAIQESIIRARVERTAAIKARILARSTSP